MKSKAPRGLIILAIISVASAIASMPSIFQPDNKIIFFGHVLSDAIFKTYYSTIIILNIAIAFGLIFLKAWAFFAYLALSVYYLSEMIFNYFLVSTETLSELGWKITEKSLLGYKSVLVIGAIMICVFAGWLWRYKKLFVKVDGC